MDIIIIAGIALIIILLIVNILNGISIKKALTGDLNEDTLRRMNEIAELTERDIRDVRETLNGEIKASRQETLQFVQTSFKSLGDMLSSNQKESAESQDKRLAELNRQLSDMTMQNELKLENIRKTMETRINALQEDNSKQLDKMRDTVDEKLQKTLEDRIGQSFKMVSERLEMVYKGLGEMQTLASGVGDLKKVLSNVKTRGALGEIQLGAILEQILSPEQYDINVTTKSSGSERVEFAIKLPGDDQGTIYLPIDAKFPLDAYQHLLDAYESGDKNSVEAAQKELFKAIRASAKTIHDKYVEPPYTTDFAILFLPVEGLYSEVVRSGLTETLQREYKISIAGPTTMAAILNSLQMGFKTLAIQKHSSEVWTILGAVKTEFESFEKVIKATQQKINQANTELDKLVGVRTRTIIRKLRDVSTLSEPEVRNLLGQPESEYEGDEVLPYDVTITDEE